MKSISDAMKGLNNTRMGSTSEICYEHERKSNGVIQTLEIMKVSHDGEVFCPMCERARTTKELSDEESNKIKRALSRRQYNVFHTQNVLTDIGLLDASFTTYETTEKEEIDNKERATKAFTRYKANETFNTWFTGVPGVGKSHLAMSILRNLNETGLQDKSCLFVSIDEMLLRIRGSFDNKESRYTESYFAELLSSVDFLVLDDLGAETGGTGTKKQATDFTLRVLYAIANGRQNKSTIITTNLTSSALVRMYDPKLVSRLGKDMFRIEFKNTVDKRLKNIDF